MAKIKYYYDTETCRYERIKTSTFDVFVNSIGILLLCLLCGAGFSMIRSIYFPTANELQLRKENEDLSYSFDLMKKEIDEVKEMLSAIQERDDNIYRVIFEAEPIPREVRQAGVGGSERFRELQEQRLIKEEHIIKLLEKVDNLKRQMYIQTKSHDEIAEMAKNKAAMLSHIPAVQPVANKDLRRFASPYGWRIDPILKVRKFHYGCDFSAEKGTPIYSTGDGVVVTVEKGYGPQGYGNQVEIDHGFGYVTKYAHMSAFDVKVGQKVKRGQKIGEVGNSGKSVAPHVHYEVIYNGQKVDPGNYFINDLTPEQYDALLEMSKLQNQSLD